MEDNQIVELFFSRNERAIVETEKKYGKYCRYIAYQILNNDEDAKEVLNDTLLKTWNTVPDNRPNPLKSYVGLISRQLALNKYKSLQSKPTHTKELIEEFQECITESSEDEGMIDEIVLSDCFNSFLLDLPVRTRKIFVQRYWYARSIAEIAEEFSMRETAVTSLLHRTRSKLKKKLKTEGIHL